MILLVSGATAALRRWPGHPNLGALLGPRSGQRAPDEALWAMDNDAFSGFSPRRFIAMLRRHRHRPGCLWVVAPDVVADAVKTRALFNVWAGLIRLYGYPVAYVLQDGIEQSDVPWDKIDCLFIGGSTEFKLGPVAAQYVQEAHERGLWTHMGRVNSRQRMRYAARIGIDSVDGSGFSKWPKYITWAVEMLEAEEDRESYANQDTT